MGIVPAPESVECDWQRQPDGLWEARRHELVMVCAKTLLRQAVNSRRNRQVSGGAEGSPSIPDCQAGLEAGAGRVAVMQGAACRGINRWGGCRTSDRYVSWLMYFLPHM